MIHNTYVDWMHPSWRDLVIEHMQDSSSSRRRFLAGCGLNGFLLALSQAGGGTGERAFPLLLDQEDWALIGKAVKRILRAEGRTAWHVLQHMKQLPISSGVSNTKEGEQRHLLSLLNVTLYELRELWSHEKWPSEPCELLWYYQLSIHITPLPPSPNLTHIWKIYVESAQQECSEFDSDDCEASVSDIKDLLELASIIAENEPRFIKQINFPACLDDMIKSIIPKLQERAELEFDLEEASNCDQESTFLRSLEELALSISRHYPLYGVQAQSIGEAADSRRWSVEETGSDLRAEQRQKWEERPAKPLPSGSGSGSTMPANLDWIDHVRSIPIEEVFADL